MSPRRPPIRALAGVAILATLATGVPLPAQVAVPGVPGDTAVVPGEAPWVGLAVVEPVVRTELARAWGVAGSRLVLDWGLVRESWTPGDAARIELKGSGRGGYWIVAVEDGRNSAAMRLRAGTRTETLVAAHDLSRGHVLTREDMTVRELHAWGPPEAGGDAARPGWTVRRTIRAGEPLAPPRVTPPDAVSSGDPVLVEWVRGPVSVTLPGTALGTVPLGGTVRVRTETGERLQGTATGPGRVRVSSNSQE